MLERILPRSLDNTWQGSRVALWLLVLVLLVKTAIALGTIFNGRTAAQRADGIPLDTFSPAAADAVVTLFAAWGLAQLVICTFGVLALTRYRAMIPLVYVLLVLEHLARRAIFLARPIATGARPGTLINLVLLAVLVLGLALSLRTRAEASP